MGKLRISELSLALLLLAITCSLAAAREEEADWWREGGAGGSAGNDWFVLKDSKSVVKTDAGEMKVVRGFQGKSVVNPMHVGFIRMDPSSLFIPQYLDSSLILFIHTGEARVGHIYKDEFVEKRLKMGDIYRIQAGSAFYLVNTAQEHMLHIICSIDASESLEWHSTQSFFIAGGAYPTSVLSGFDHTTLSTAFNVSEAELSEMFGQNHGPIIHLSADSQSSSVWSEFLDMEHPQKLAHMRKMVRSLEEDTEEKEEEKDGSTCSLMDLLISTIFGKAVDRKEDRSGKKFGKGPGACNIYHRKPDFQNNYGWSVAVDESEYSPLKDSDIGVYLVNLTKGSMMAPHINPRATEYGVVLRGSGMIQIVFPNGSLAMNAKVSEGDVFWIPRYFPVCQVASRDAPFEFFGFSTSARNNRPQFLIGANSLLHTMKGPEFAASFGMSHDRFERIVDSQRESTILPASWRNSGPA